jgi:uncharacterized membrane protein
VTGIIGGLLAAFLWGSLTVTDARATRIVGCTLMLPVALVFAHDSSGVNAGGLFWLAVSSLAAVAAFAPFYRAVQLGPVAPVAGLGATEGGVAAAISTGDRRAAAGAHAARPDRRRSGCRPAAARSAPCSSHLRHVVDRARARELFMGKLPPPSRFLRFTFYSALAQSAGYLAFLGAAGASGVSVPAVLASQASVVGMLISFLVLGERLSRRRLAGIAVLLTGVAVVAATR